MSVIKYKRLDYIESTGNGQLIHTGVLMQDITKIEIDVQATKTNVVQGVLGRYTSTNSTMQIMMNNSTRRLVSKWGSNSFSVDYDTNKHKIELSNTSCVVDGITLGTYQGSDLSDSGDIIIFARRTDNSGSGIKNSAYIKVFGCKIYFNDILIRDFIPALDNNDVPCLYDKVNDEFYYNAGTGDFIAGTIQETVYTDLIYDRTQEDVDYALNNSASTDFLKGAYNYTDLNRIEEWCEYIKEQLNLYKYSVSIVTRTNWAMNDFPTKVEMKRIRDNVEALKNAYYSFTQVPENLEKMTYQKANSIEKILNEMNKFLENMKASFLYSGTFYSGESEGLIV